jgi:hypothetical protein
MSLGAAASTAASAAGDFELDRADQTAAGAAAALQADASMEQQKMVRSKTNKVSDKTKLTRLLILGSFYPNFFTA